jgi:ectoine hydroxylase-related dioxygenase (phytanoyl-CoA dioxygenase family)
MNQIIHNVIDSNLINNIILSSNEIIKVSEKRHFSSSGKSFFVKDEKGVQFLCEIVKCLIKKSNIISAFTHPFIDHAYLLFKSPGGNETPPHQDRPFWISKEEIPTMITCWIALEEINAHNGALKVASLNQDCLSNFNSTEQIIIEHVKPEKSYPGNFNFEINESEKLSLNMKVVELNKGDVLFFDAFEVHSSMPNNSGTTRLAMKVVFREGGGLFSVQNLINKPLSCLKKIRRKYFFLRLLNPLKFLTHNFTK